MYFLLFFVLLPITGVRTFQPTPAVRPARLVLVI